jgi:poly-gamma-glutamate synthesis protein (capsule biosynthesis protein)
MDYFEVGLEETLDHLDTYSLGHAGAGFDRDKIYQPYRFEKNAEKISILCVADGEMGNERFNNGVGTADVTSFRVVDQIRKSKAEGYFTVVFVHAGVEFLPYPPPFIQDMYRNRHLDLQDCGTYLG